MDEENKDLETPLSKMSPEQKEHLEKLQAIMQEKFEKRKFKANLKLREQRKAAEKRTKKAKVEKKQRKINRRKK
jgi:excinuclease UvrABC nuclease subunit